MNETEYLLTCLAEECNEVAQRVSKALRFGLREIQPGQELTNAERIGLELTDLSSVMLMLTDRGIFPKQSIDEARTLISEKVAKVKKFMDYSRKCETLT